MKRLFDIFFVTFVLLLTWPILIVCAIAVRVDSPGSIFYRQQRVGYEGKIFDIYKFRSMVRNADQIGSYQTMQGDSRITSIGALLRRTSLDELPQLLNVLKGDMSLVGPRPDVPAQRELYSDGEWARRVSVRPGITGLAQATLRSAATKEQRRSLDLEYVDKASLLLDLKILLLTMRQIFSKGGV